MKRVLGDAAISVTALILLLGVLAAVDPRVREGVTRLVGGAPRTGEFQQIGRDLRGLSAVVLDAAWDQGLMHMPLVMFTLAALVLVLFMVRT